MKPRAVPVAKLDADCVGLWDVARAAARTTWVCVYAGAYELVTAPLLSRFGRNAGPQCITWGGLVMHIPCMLP